VVCEGRVRWAPARCWGLRAKAPRGPERSACGERNASRGGRKETAARFAKVKKLLIELKPETIRRDIKDRRGNKKTSQLTRKLVNDRSSTAPSDHKRSSLSYTYLKSK